MKFFPNGIPAFAAIGGGAMLTRLLQKRGRPS
jgi:hypothetical protein